MGIVDEDVERVKAAADFVQIASEHIGGLKKSGRNWAGLCPFHAEKTPSFSIRAEEGLYYCFGCQAGGDIISFVRGVRHLDFVEAVEWLAARTGVQLRYDDARAGQDRKRKHELTEAMEKAVAWYHDRLLSAADAGGARSYLRSRGYDRSVVEQFRIGWAPDDWDALAKALKLPADVLEDTGLGFVNRRGRIQDTFRGRLLFPIFDASGHPVAFGGRVLPGVEGPKYKNSAETKLYSKSRTLYALNWAKEEAGRKGEILVCEGYTDVIGCFLAGMPRAVATCGTALADEHFQLLKNFARRIVLAYDADAAGQSAAARFYEWEQRYEVSVAVAALPSGADPADVAREDPAALVKAVEHAKPFLEFRIDRLLAGADLRSPEGRARAAEGALAMIVEHPNELVREQYASQVAVRCGLPADRLQQAASKRARPRIEVPVRRPQRDDSPELQVLRLLAQRPEEMASMPLDDVLFEDELHAAAFRALRSAARAAEAAASAPPEVSELIHRVAVEDTEAEPEDPVTLLIEKSTRRALTQLVTEQRAAADPGSYAASVQWLRLTIELLRESDTRVEASDQLVAWLVQFGQEGE